VLLDTMSRDVLKTRKRILAAALELMEKGEGRGVRMADVARRAGITRQALYLHFDSRAKLLIATTHYLDEVVGAEQRLVASRAAKTGVERLDAYIEAWGSYIPEIYGLAKAFLDMKGADEAAAAAWEARMSDMREGCEAAIKALRRDKMLMADYSQKEATDLLWTLLSVRNWEQLTQQCGWSQKKYITRQKRVARRLFVAE